VGASRDEKDARGNRSEMLRVRNPGLGQRAGPQEVPAHAERRGRPRRPQLSGARARSPTPRLGARPRPAEFRSVPAPGRSAARVCPLPGRNRQRTGSGRHAHVDSGRTVPLPGHERRRTKARPQKRPQPTDREVVCGRCHTSNRSRVQNVGSFRLDRVGDGGHRARAAALTRYSRHRTGAISDARTRLAHCFRSSPATTAGPRSPL
jgi:hypothetical protein